MTVVAAPATAASAFEHEGYFYRGEAEFVGGVAAFVRAGLELDETVVVAEPPAALLLLREALGPDAADVTWLDMAEIGGNPARIIGVWATALDRAVAGGHTLRGVGEPAFGGRRGPELAECELHERLLNMAFADGPPWRLLCPYDQEHLPAAVCASALTTHPVHSTLSGRALSEGWTGADCLTAFGARLPTPTGVVLRGEYRADDVRSVRRTVAAWARSCGLPAGRVEDLELAATELTTNSIRHGGGSGRLALWVEDDAAVAEFTDRGQVRDPLIGRRAPSPEQEGGRGLYLVNQLCDLVQLRSSPAGTTVRVLTWLD